MRNQVFQQSNSYTILQIINATDLQFLLLGAWPWAVRVGSKSIVDDDAKVVYLCGKLWI